MLGRGNTTLRARFALVVAAIPFENGREGRCCEGGTARGGSDALFCWAGPTPFLGYGPGVPRRGTSEGLACGGPEGQGWAAPRYGTSLVEVREDFVHNVSVDDERDDPHLGPQLGQTSGEISYTRLIICAQLRLIRRRSSAEGRSSTASGSGLGLGSSAFSARRLPRAALE